MVSTGRGLMYVAIPAVKLASDYKALTDAGRDPTAAATQAVSKFAGISPTTGKFDMAVIVDTYKPVVAWTIVDYGLSKAGIYKRVGRLLKF